MGFNPFAGRSFFNPCGEIIFYTLTLIGQRAANRKIPYIKLTLKKTKISFCLCTIGDKNVALPAKGLNKKYFIILPYKTLK